MPKQKKFIVFKDMAYYPYVVVEPTTKENAKAKRYGTVGRKQSIKASSTCVA
jgi:hypothetical protein